MRMHRGSSKGRRGRARRPESLPLSASPPADLAVTFVVERAGRTELRVVRVPAGTPIRRAVRLAGLAPEGCAVLRAGRSIPLDRPIERAVRLQLIPTFSGG